MPKTPILSRQTFYAENRGASAGTLKHLEFNVVETELGTMVEPRSWQNFASGEPSKLVNVDLTDAAPNAIKIMSEEAFQAQYGTGGNGGLVDTNA